MKVSEGSDFARGLSTRLALHGIALNPEQLLQLWRYYELLRKWNRRVNLTSLPLTGFPAQTLDRLLVEPLVAASLLQNPRLYLDLGSGGGSPGLPIGVVWPKMRAVLVESRQRKSVFLREALREMPLRHGDVLTMRAEAMPHDYRRQADVVTARSVKLDAKLTGLIPQLLDPAGCLLVFGAQAAPTGFRIAEEYARAGISIRKLVNYS